MPEVEAQRRVALEHRAPVGGRDQPVEAERVLIGGARVGQDRHLARRAVRVERVERGVEAVRERQVRAQVDVVGRGEADRRVELDPQEPAGLDGVPHELERRAGSGGSGRRRGRRAGLGCGPLRPLDLPPGIEGHERMKARVGPADAAHRREARDSLLDQDLLPERRRRAIVGPGVVVDQRRREQRDRGEDPRDRGGDRAARVRHQVERRDVAGDDLALVGADGERQVLGQLVQHHVERLRGQRRHRPDRRAGDERDLAEHRQLGVGRRRGGVGEPRDHAHEGAHGDLGPAAHQARQLGEPRNEVGDESDDRQIERAEGMTVNVDGCRTRGRDRRRRALASRPSAASPTAPAPPTSRSRRRGDRERIRGRACSRCRRWSRCGAAWPRSPRSSCAASPRSCRRCGWWRGRRRPRSSPGSPRG